MEVICINDKNRPNEVPSNRWIKKDEVYTVIKADKLLTQGNILGFKLAEINNDDLAPYQYFRADRFAPVGDISELTEINEKEEIL